MQDQPEGNSLTECTLKRAIIPLQYSVAMQVDHLVDISASRIVQYPALFSTRVKDLPHEVSANKSAIPAQIRQYII